MADERAVAAIMGEIPDLPLPDARYTQGSLKHLVARHILAALRAEGFDLYRPDECRLMRIIKPDERPEKYPSVPVGGEG